MMGLVIIALLNHAENSTKKQSDGSSAAPAKVDVHRGEFGVAWSAQTRRYIDERVAADPDYTPNHDGRLYMIV